MLKIINGIKTKCMEYGSKGMSFWSEITQNLTEDKV